MNRTVHAVASWHGQQGPLRVPSALEAASRFARMIAHVAAAAGDEAGVMPWVLATPTPAVASRAMVELASVFVGSRDAVVVSAGPRTVAMGLVHALVASAPVLLVVAGDASSTSDAVAAALRLGGAGASLADLGPPQRRREPMAGAARLPAAIAENPVATAVDLARRLVDGRPGWVPLEARPAGPAPPWAVEITDAR